ncbi:MAG: hypothetical protein Q9164_000895, partial [Protoblastenia rupestris]
MSQPDQAISHIGDDTTTSQANLSSHSQKDQVQDAQAHLGKKTKSKGLPTFGQNAPTMIKELPTMENTLPFDYRDFVKDCVQEVMAQVFKSFDLVPRRPGTNQVTEVVDHKYDHLAPAMPHMPGTNQVTETVARNFDQAPTVNVRQPQNDSSDTLANPTVNVGQPQDVAVILNNPPHSAKQGDPIPTSEVETVEAVAKMLRSFWSPVLGIPKNEIRDDDSFFAFGGDSILAMELVSVAREAGLTMTVEDIFMAPNFLDMAHSILRSTQKRRYQLEHSEDSSSNTMEKEDLLADTKQDQRFSLLNASDTETFIQDYICPKVGVFRGAIVDAFPVTDFQAVALAGTLVEAKWMLNYFIFDGVGFLDMERFRKSAIGLVQLFDILRTVFVPCGNRFLQVVLRTLRPSIQIYETTDDFDDYTRYLRDHGPGACPQLGDPYVQFIVIKKPTSLAHRIIIRLSHAQYDGLCLSRILEAFKAIYEGRETLPSPPFSDYIMEARASDAYYDYWKGLLRGSTMTNVVHREQPAYRASDLTNTALPGVRRIIKMPSNGVKNFTVATILKAAWTVTLAQLSGSSDIVFGNLVSGRNLAMTGVESVVGPCVNIIPVRIKLEAKWTVLDLLRRLRDQQIGSMSYESLGFREIVQHCTDWPEWTYFSSIIQHQNFAKENSLELGRNKYKSGMLGMADTLADITVVSTPKGKEMVEVALDFVDDGTIPSSFVEKALDVMCTLAQKFASTPTSTIPISVGAPDAKLLTPAPEVIPSFEYSQSGSMLRDLKKSEVFEITDTLSRAWR